MSTLADTRSRSELGTNAHEDDTPPGETEFVKVSGVTKHFGEVCAVSDASFNLAQGEFMTILGPSGSGKSTLLRMIAGFFEPTRGDIEVQGLSVKGLPPYERSIGMVFQRLALFPHMTASQNVAYPLRMRGFNRSEIPDRVARYLKLVHLEGLGKRRVQQLSGGQQQRVAIARALVFEPDLLLLDEPLGSLDKKLRESMQLEFRRIQQELGVTTINVTHDEREGLVMSDRLLVMHQAKIQQAADPESVYRAPTTRFVAGFLGVTNFVTATVRSMTNGIAELDAAGCTLYGRCMSTDADLDGRAVDAAIRAEQIQFIDERDAAGEDISIHDATIRQVIFEGDRLSYTVELDTLNTTLKVFDYEALDASIKRVGDRVAVGWRTSDLMVFPETLPSRGEKEDNDGPT